ncbi:hypothetical protein X922_17710 [Pseudomonas aeruginosa VRFPA08]|nr:hypothetical protein X922_17710 [Pseudomonas aeruginosa VRFPA08]
MSAQIPSNKSIRASYKNFHRLFLWTGTLATLNCTNEIQLQQQLFHSFDIQTFGIMRIIVLCMSNFFLALLHKLTIVQITQIWGDTIIVTHVFSTGHFLSTKKRLIKLLSMTRTYYIDRITILAKQLSKRMSQHLDGCSRCFLYKKISIGTMLESIKHKVYGIRKRHHETCHVWISDCERLA